MEEPKKPGKNGKKRATKTVTGTRERPLRRNQGEPVAEGEAVVVTAEAVTGCGGKA